MKYFQFFAQLNPEISFSTPNFDNYLNVLSGNFLFAIFFFLAFMALAFVCYYALCILFMVWKRYMSFSYNYEDADVQVEMFENA